MKKKMMLLMSLMIIVTAGYSILNSNVYFGFVDGDYIAESIGQDIVSLLAAIMLFIMVAIGKMTIRKKMMFLGLLLYFIYAYSIYAFGSVYNLLFINYLFIIGTSFYLSVGYFLELYDTYLVEKSKTTDCQSKPLTRKYGPAIFLLLTSGLLTMIWGVSVIEHIKEGTIARETVIYVFDLALVLPFFAYSGICVLKGHLVGKYLSRVAMVKALTIGLSILSGQTVKCIQGYPLDGFLVILFSVFTFLALWINVKMDRDYIKKENDFFMQAK